GVFTSLAFTAEIPANAKNAADKMIFFISYVFQLLFLLITIRVCLIMMPRGLNFGTLLINSILHNQS
ncbi:hypothetical protein, partial [Pedobacter caeni]|uniref:hypothetical protein n=1 Tax=Pedobacter caeni TaxID=288992 RepID=UPI001F482FF6